MNNIPKIIHQIWLGTLPIPSSYLKCMETIKEKHPTWEYKLWTDDNLPTDFILKESFEGNNLVADDMGNPNDPCSIGRLKNNYARKADVLRLSLLWHFGGVYMDVDMEALKPIDDLLTGLEFFIGSELWPAELWAFTNSVKSEGHTIPIPACTTNSIIGSAPNSKFLELPIKIVEERHSKEGFQKLVNEKSTSIPKLCGPLLWQDVTCNPDYGNPVLYRLNPACKIFDPPYFYPFRWDESVRPRDIKIPTDPQLYPESYLVHHYGATWMYSPVVWLDTDTGEYKKLVKGENTNA